MSITKSKVLAWDNTNQKLELFDKGLLNIESSVDCIETDHVLDIVYDDVRNKIWVYVEDGKIYRYTLTEDSTTFNVTLSLEATINFAVGSGEFTKFMVLDKDGNLFILKVFSDAVPQIYKFAFDQSDDTPIVSKILENITDHYDYGYSLL